MIFSKGGFGSRGRRTGLLGVTWDLRCFLISMRFIMIYIGFRFEDIVLFSEFSDFCSE